MSSSNVIAESMETGLRAQLVARRGPAAVAVTRRAVAALASRADLAIDRIDDALLITDALLADRELQRSGSLNVELTARPGALELRLGPLLAGDAQRLLADAALPGIGSVIERLATKATTVQDGDGEYLAVVIATS